MLAADAYARQLDVELDAIGNGPDALDALLAALDRMNTSDEALIEALDPMNTSSADKFVPMLEDWKDYDDYLERLEYESRYHVNLRFVE